MRYSDVVIIGGGPAGITAGIYIKRAGFKVLIISKGEGALIRTEKIENYYGFETPISGKELIEKGEKQAKNLGIELIKKVGDRVNKNDILAYIYANEEQKGHEAIIQLLNTYEISEQKVEKIKDILEIIEGC